MKWTRKKVEERILDSKLTQVWRNINGKIYYWITAPEDQNEIDNIAREIRSLGYFVKIMKAKTKFPLKIIFARKK